MTLADLITLIQGQHWLGLILLLTVLVRKWTGPDSKFPVFIAPTWQPTVTAAGGLVYGLVSSLQSGAAPLDATLAMLSAAGAGGFFDGFLMAIFNHDNAPKWARWIVGIFDDVTTTGGATGATGAPTGVTGATGVSLKLPTTVIKREWGVAKISSCFVFMVALFGVSTAGCLPPGSSLPTDVGGAVSCVIADLIAGSNIDDCINKWGLALVTDAVQILTHSQSFASDHPDQAAKLPAMRQVLKMKGAALL
jgi:hypothetical protein